MANLGNSVKTAFLKGLEALGKTASSLTDAAQHKLNEMNLENRRSEVLSAIPKCVKQLWADGVELPEPLAALLTELADIEQQLAALRPQPEPKPVQEEAAEEEPVSEEETAPAEEEAPSAEEAPAEDALVCEEEVPCEPETSETDETI